MKEYRKADTTFQMKELYFVLITALLVLTFFSAAARAKEFNADDKEQVEEKLTRVADYVLQNTQPQEYEWNWGDNLIMRGLIMASDVTGRQDWLEFVCDWLDVYTAGMGQYMVLEVDDAASAFSSVLAYQRTGNSQYAKGTKRAEKFIRKGARRLDNGAVIHQTGEAVWLDTAYMIAPYMAHFAKLRDDAALLDDAVHQIITIAKRTEEPQTGLSWHAYDAAQGRIMGTLWARGNAWIVMAATEVLDVLPDEHPRRDELLRLLQDRCTVIAGLQHQDGLWHTVLNRTDSYLEVSASAMYAYVFRHGASRGWLPEMFHENAERALRAVVQNIEPSGRVMGVSAGTIPGTFDEYQGIPTGEYKWGTGAALMLLSEYYSSVTGD